MSSQGWTTVDGVFNFAGPISFSPAASLALRAGVGQTVGGNTYLAASDGGQYLYTAPGFVAINSANLIFAVGGAADTGISRLGPGIFTMGTNVQGEFSGTLKLTTIVNVGQISTNAGTAIPAGGNTAAGILMSSTANFGVFFGSGVPSLSAAQGSLYIRSDGASNVTRAYINTTGSTTWTAINTVG